MQPAPHRLVPQKTFPSYTHVPGRTPHPNSHPEGHSFNTTHDLPGPLTEDSWKSSSHYLYGFDLFNYGYYWEAHDVWEGIWIANGRTGSIATFLKGLIKLAAAGVKNRERKPKGVQKHCQRAVECFMEVVELTTIRDENFLGFSLDTLTNTSQQIASSQMETSNADLQSRSKDVPVEPVKAIPDIILIPQI